MSNQTCSSGHDITCLLEVLNTDVVHREESCCSSILRTHVGDGGSVSDGQLSNTGAVKLYELSHDTHLPQVLTAQVGKGQCQTVTSANAAEAEVHPNTTKRSLHALLF